MSEDSEEEARYNSELEEEEEEEDEDCDDSSDEDYVTPISAKDKSNTRSNTRASVRKPAPRKTASAVKSPAKSTRGKAPSKTKGAPQNTRVQLRSRSNSNTNNKKEDLNSKTAANSRTSTNTKTNQNKVMDSHDQLSRSQNNLTQSQLASQIRSGAITSQRLHHQMSQQQQQQQQQMRSQLNSNYAQFQVLQNQSRHNQAAAHQVVSHTSQLQQLQQQQQQQLTNMRSQRQLYSSTRLRSSNRSQAASSGPAGIHPSQKVPIGLSNIAGYTNSGNVANLSNAHAASRYSTSSVQVAQAAQAAAVSAMTASYPGMASTGSFPINPDVKLKNLPFYDTLGELLKPSSLAPHGAGRYQETVFAFSMTPQQANKIASSRDIRPGKQDYLIQVQMRFCLLETTCEQEDNFPPNIAVKINDKMCPLPSPIPANKAGVEPKRPSRPVNITALCRISPTVSNKINVSWSSEYGRCYVISVYLVQKLTSDDLLTRLKNKGARIADFTRSLIKQKLKEDADCEIATTSLRCSLLCPLGKMKMMLPCRAKTCDHLQCFDASLFLQMNERKPTWTCPVCDKPALYNNLMIDGYFQDVLGQNNNINEITLQKDGSWTPLIPKKEAPKQEVVEKKKSEVAIETLSDDSDDEQDTRNDVESTAASEEAKKRKADVECITLTDSEDEGGPPPAKKQHTASAVPVENLGQTEKIESVSNNSDNGVIAQTPAGSSSPQIICLDSPAPSPSPPTHTNPPRTASPPNVTLTPTNIVPEQTTQALNNLDHGIASTPALSVEPIPAGDQRSTC